MHMVCYAVDDQVVLAKSVQGAAQITEKFGSPRIVDQRGAVFNGEDDLNVDLGVSVYLRTPLCRT